MFVLHVDLEVKPDSRQALEKIYVEIFRRRFPAGGIQRGRSVAPQGRWRPLSAQPRVDHQSFQQKWVATDLHQEVWPQMDRHCVQYSIMSYDAV